LEEAGQYEAREKRRDLLHVVAEAAQDILHSDAGIAAKKYLINDRGFTEDQIRDFGFGYIESVPELERRLKEKGLDVKEAWDAGVLWRKSVGYICIPWNDANGNLMTLYFRWPSAHLPAGKLKALALPGEGSKGSPLYFDRVLKAGHRRIVAVDEAWDHMLRGPATS